MKKLFTLALSCFLIANISIAQTTINGTIKDASSGETLIGATVLIKGTTEGAVTDVDGNFSFSTTRSLPLTVVASFVGFINIETNVTSTASPLVIRIKKNEVLLKNVTVTGSRISEKQKENPLTVESMDYIAVKETPAINFYEGLAQLKGVDLTSASIGFKIINTRGFNSSSPVRSLQLIDGVDNQSPGLNFSLGNFLGCSELDVQKVDLVVGASSAYYGPNAFNGVIAMTTRSPFESPGFQYQVKIGDRNLIENAFRLAQVFKNKNGEDKFAYKFGMCYLKVRDWEAENYEPTSQSLTDENNPGGYDAVNVYGDEFISGSDYTQFPGAYPGLGAFYRQGYQEKDLVDYNTNNLKLNVALHYKITPKIEAIIASNYGTGTTVYQGDNRYSLKDIQFIQNRIEVRQKDRWFVRAYATNEDAGKSYDAFFTALLLQQKAKSDGDWKIDYENYWNNHYNLFYIKTFPGFPQPPAFGPAYAAWLQTINPFLMNNYYDSLTTFHNAAQAYASGVGNPVNNNTALLQPGTYEFDTTFAGITSRSTYKEGGSRFFDRSALYHVQGEYKYPNKFVDVVAGGSYRRYKPNSQGTIFSDTAYVKYQIDTVSGDTLSSQSFRKKIVVDDVGTYVGLEKKLFKDKLKLNVTGRFDSRLPTETDSVKNYNVLFSPAYSVVYVPNPNHVLRVSYSTAIRNPTLTDQYLYYQVGRAILLGNKEGYKDLLTIPSVVEFFDSNKSNFEILDYFNLEPVRPEKVRTIEAGYRATLFNHIYLDLNGYYSRYKDFIGYRVGIQADTFSIYTPFGNLNDIIVDQAVRVASNAESEVTTQGISTGLTFYFGKYYALTGNYSYNILNKKGTDDPLIPAFNTPANKFNIGMNGRDIHGFGFNINYKWVQGFTYEGSPQFTGSIPSYDIVDAQINYNIKEAGTTFKVGATNLLRNKHYEIYGGPKVGRLFYFSVLFEVGNL